VVHVIVAVVTVVEATTLDIERHCVEAGVIV
jgi:hypothetical protein